MKIILQNIYFMILFAPLSAYAQWEGKIGLNVVPLLAGSGEVTTEFSNRSWYSLTADAGYTFNTAHLGFFGPDLGDSYHNRRTSGGYGRLGVRFYTNVFGPSRKVRFYANPLLVISNYRQTAVFRYDVNPKLTSEAPVKVSGTILVPALRIGFTRVISDRFVLDFGAQQALTPKRDDMIGYKPRNYQPGLGSGQSTEYIRYLQGYLTFKFCF